MEKQRKAKIFSIVALIVAVLGLTVAFAALSETLTINGTANVESAQWDIHFENLTGPTIKGTAREVSSPSLSDTELTGINIALMKPGDSISYEFDVVNSGSIDAEISDVSYIVPEETDDYETLYKQNYDWDGDGETTEQDLKKVQEAISYEIVYDGFSTNFFSDNLKGKIINADEIKHVVLKIEFDPNYEEIPKGKIIDGPITFNINYVQK